MPKKSKNDKGIEIAIVIGGGNIFRGVAGASNGMDRVKGLHGNASHSYQRNGFARCLRRQRDAYRLQTALKIEAIAEPYIKRRAASP
jgi:uridylate kinase